MRTRTRAALAALPLALTLALTGCGSGDGDNDREVASANGETQDDGAEPTAPPSQDDLDEMNLKLAGCLREHGVDVDDPEPGQGIALQNEGPEDLAKTEEAMEACEEYMARGGRPSEEEADEAREDMLTFAECMRDNGVEEFADPKPGEGINIGPDVVEDPDFEAAEQTCQEALGLTPGERVESEREERGQ